MRTRAPGKVVLSGAYAVLEGAPSLVAAVDRYVSVDSNVAAEFLTDEVKAAGLPASYWFDASALRHDGRKLGLGSSAAILVATLAAHCLVQPNPPSPESLGECVYPDALAAHRLAQGGGSGIDVAASCYGGFLQFQLHDGGTRVRRLGALSTLCFEVWTSTQAASTAAMLAQVREYAERCPAEYRRDIAAQSQAAEATAGAWSRQDQPGVILGLLAQRHALQRLGANARIPIVTHEVETLSDIAEQHGAAVLPAGAGGGDIALYVGREPSSCMIDELLQYGHARLPVLLGADGVHADINPRKSGPT
jgi:phosphomevalonate kinase